MQHGALKKTRRAVRGLRAEDYGERRLCLARRHSRVRTALDGQHCGRGMEGAAAAKCCC